MYKFTPYIKYRIGEAVYENSKSDCEHYSLELEATDDAIKCILHPKLKIELIEFNVSAIRKMAHGELFFSNGYQSWTTSREYSPKDTVKGYTPLAKLSRFTRGLAGISGDYEFTQYGVQGCFHSHTYTYFRNGEEVELFGSRSERCGYTVFCLNCPENSFKIVKDVEGLVIDKDCEIFDIVSFSGKYDDVFDKYFGSMDLRKPKIQHLSGYTSWYNYFKKIDESIILRDLDGLEKAKDDVSIFQIDDGYESYVGDWLVPDKKKFSNGMKPIADAVHSKGYLAGIWIAPFSVQRVSKTAKEHPDWLIKDNATGKPLWGCPGWGGAYTLDIYNPEVRKYIKKFFNVILNEWGYDMVKLDFLYSEAMQPRAGKSRGQIMCEAMNFLRECVGEDKLILGCGVPLGPSFGVVDACRISCDVDLVYKGRFYSDMNINLEVPSAQNAINNSIFRRHLNGRVFCNDPDVFFLRNNNLTFNTEQKLLLGKINNMCGDVLFISDNAGDYSAVETEYLKKFFKPSKCKILYAEYISDNDMFIRFVEDTEETTLRFNIKTGKSNVTEIL